MRAGDQKLRFDLVWPYVADTSEHLQSKGESGSKAQSYYSAEQAGSLGVCSLRKV